MMLAGAGYEVVLAGRRADPLGQTAADIRALGRRALPVVTDVGSADAVRALFDTTRREFARLDLLFNNAGMAATAPIDELDAADWQAVINVNLTGAFLCTREAFRLMKQQQPQGGRIINNGSISATTPRPHSAAYTASKHGISGLTKSTALDGRPYDIACGQIDIGNAATALASHSARGALQPNGSTLVEPMLDMAAVTEAVKYMASLPLNANVLSLTVMATKMPFVGRG
jgi:NAD(P)-dependent dehydrogenase (short-subunit alcohol dehydrogenase family)